ncbi:MAG: hypothetical protein COB85_05960 [Bacteroidetes bacterium]|nr:MAG: hypothetical protein COB85_05960 [Bacteroidota bacterium]
MGIPIKKRLLQIGLWSFIFVGLAFVMGFVAVEHRNQNCEKIHVEIDYSEGYFFVEPEDVRAMIRNDGIELLGKPISAIDFQMLESLIANNPHVENVQVYSLISGDLKIEISQRTPMLRLMPRSMRGFYLDKKGVRMELSKKYTARVTLANGFIKNDMVSDLFLLATFVNNNKFWQSQLQQIYVDSAQQILLIPRVGRHKIILGEVRNLENKFSHLLAFYKDGLNKIGWNRYETIDLSYEGQIVCTK